MIDKSDVDDIKTELDRQHCVLRTLIHQNMKHYLGFSISGVQIKEEQDVLANGFTHIPVCVLRATADIPSFLSAWTRYGAGENMSTRFVYRMPGIVVVPYNEMIIETVADINRLKSSIAAFVRMNRTPEQRHEFIHERFPGIMTEQLYRKINLEHGHIKNAWFNWTRRPVPRAYTKDQAIAFVTNQQERPRNMEVPSIWKARMEALAQDMRYSRVKRYQRYKLYKALPTVTLNKRQSDGTFVRLPKNATTPIILMGQDDLHLPTYSELGDYHAPVDSPTFSMGKNKILLDSSLKLVAVKETTSHDNST
jgi:hypothetical protein